MRAPNEEKASPRRPRHGLTLTPGHGGPSLSHRCAAPGRSAPRHCLGHGAVPRGAPRGALLFVRFESDGVQRTALSQVRETSKPIAGKMARQRHSQRLSQITEMPIDHTQFGAFLAALFALVASPGPATLALAGAGAAFGVQGARRFLFGSICGAALTISLVGSGVAGALLGYPGVAPVLIGLAAAYMVYLAYRIATAPPIGDIATNGRTPGFAAGFVLGITNPKGYAVFATLFAGFVVLPDNIAGDALVKGIVLMILLTMIDVGWLLAGNALRPLFHDPKISRRINIAFAILLIASVALAAGL